MGGGDVEDGTCSSPDQRPLRGNQKRLFPHDTTSKEKQTGRFAIENGYLFDSVSGTNTERGVRDTGSAIRFRPDEKYFDTVKLAADFA